MWIEELNNKSKKYRYYEKYKDEMTGKWKRVSVAMNTKTKQAQKEANHLLNMKINNKLNDKKPSEYKQLTLREAYSQWELFYKTTSGNKRSTIKTYLTKGKILKKILDFDVLISQLNLSYIQNCFNKLSKYDYSNQTNRDVLSIFKKVMDYVKINYNVTFPFLSDIKAPKKNTTLKEITKKRNNYLEQNELSLILDELYVMMSTANNTDNKRHYFFVYYIVEFLSLNGMRIGELLAIENQNVDLKNKKLTIDGTILRIQNENGHYGVKDTTKNQSSYRTIDLTERSCTILRNCMLENKKSSKWDKRFNERDFVFTNYRGNPMYFHRINEALEKARKNLNIDKKITTHTLRHTHISLLTQMGISIKAIMERVGHSDHRTTLEIYTHVTSQMKNDMINKLEEIEQYSKF
ncbi:site-specific integrase [Mammaliicoccus lentus]|uniref:tyrosine-type recombinase/integrase n=1 Tax=Mammaliicoccus TaxID=2803850 RepID=UPI001EFA4B39|nr:MULTISPECIES: site-specific integrase [Mammaliicoccus]MCR1872132.1 site-specific integrase [Mammaliicoccus lentus]